MESAQNPFPLDPDRSEIWEMLVRRDIAAFVASDWSRVADDFDGARFLGIDAGKSTNPDDWVAAFPTLEDYRDEWLRQAQESAATGFAEPLEPAIHRATQLTEIDISGDFALARKKFDGCIAKADGTFDVLNWQTHYHCRKAGGRWRIVGFIGYLKYR